MGRINLLCPYCGADAVQKDAFACWDVDTQDWVLQSTYDNMCCAVCGEDFTEAREVGAIEVGEEVIDAEAALLK